LDAADQFVRVTRVLALSDERNFIAGALCFQKLVFTSVHQGMVIPAFKVLASDKQIRHWLPKLVDFTAIGCYA
jgi:alkylation response protein AidB-like acyl-CoA dehydrogenase